MPRSRACSSASAAIDGDLVFFGADKTKVANDAMGALRLALGRDRKLLEGAWRPLWVIDFPMLEAMPGGGWTPHASPVHVAAGCVRRRVARESRRCSGAGV